MNKRSLYYELVKRQTEQNEAEMKNELIENKTTTTTTITIGVPLADKKFSTSFNTKDSI